MKTEVQGKLETGAAVAAPKTDARQRRQILPLARVRESADGYDVQVDLPAVEESALHVNVDNRTLTVEADTEQAAHGDYRVVREEFPPAHFRAAYELPERVDTTRIQARLQGGVLYLTLPLREEVKPRRIEIGAA